jgi:hypothetical protein
MLKIKNIYQFIYGMLMGTSVELLHKTKKPSVASHFQSLNESVFLHCGGTGQSLIFKSRLNDVSLVDLNGIHAASYYNQFLREENITQIDRLILTRVAEEKMEALWDLKVQVQEIWSPMPCPRAYESFAPKWKVISDNVSLPQGIQIQVFNVGTEKMIAVKLVDSNLLFAGDLFFGHIHPPLHRWSRFEMSLWLEAQNNCVAGVDSLYFTHGDCKDPSEIQIEVRDCEEYLLDLCNKSLEYGFLYDKYNAWKEIVGYSSFTDNFDFIRKI